MDITFESLPGPASDANFDWGGWSMPVLVGDDVVLREAMKKISNWVNLWTSGYRFDLLVMAGLTMLNLPLLLTAPYELFWDAVMYLNIAMNFANGHGFTLPSGYPALSTHPYLYPLLLTLFIKITHTATLPVAVWPVKIFAVFTAWAVYALGKRLFNPGAGVLSAVMVTFSLIFRDSYNTAHVDTIRDFFVIVGLLLMVVNYERRGAWLVWSGLSMGLAFLQKETAFFWIPIPWLLFFIDWRYRRNVRLIDLWAYTALVAIPVGGWLLWCYHWMGRMNPASEELTALLVQWGGPALLLAILGSWVFCLADDRLTWFASWSRGRWWRRISLTLLTGGILLFSPLAALLRYNWGYASQPWIELPAYVGQRSDYFPAVGLFVAIWVIIVIWAIWKENPGAIVGTLALAMGYPLLISLAQTNLSPRNIAQIMYISCVLLAGTLFWGLEWLRGPHRRFWRIVYGMGVLGIAGFTVWFVQHQNTAFNTLDKRLRQHPPLNRMRVASTTIMPIATWIQDNLPPGTSLLANQWIEYALASHTDGRYPIFTLPMLYASLDPSQPNELLTPDKYRQFDYYPLPPVPKTLPKEEMFYLTYQGLAKYYAVFLEKDIFAWIENNQIEYLILGGEWTFQKSTLYLDYFTSHPAFELVWSAQPYPRIPFYILRVNRAKLHTQRQYPLVVSPAILERIITDEPSGSWDLEKIVDYFPRGLSLRPLETKDVDLARKVAQHYLEVGRFSPAYNLYKEINTAAPGYLVYQLALEPQEPLGHLTRCVTYLVEEQLERAAEACHHAVTVLPESSVPHVALGEVSMAQNQPEQAIGHYQKASELDRSDTTYIRLGDAYRLSGHFEEAREAYRQAVALEPKNTIAQMHLAETDAFLALAKGQREEALWSYGKATDVYPGYWPTASSMTQDIRQATNLYQDPEFERGDASVSNHVFAGNIYLLHEEWDQAAREYREALKLNPDHILAYLGLAQAYQAQGQMEQATVTYEKGVAANPDEVWLRIYLAQTYENLGKIEQAITEYEKAVAISLDEIWPRFYPAEAYVAKGRLAEESEAYEKAITAYRLAFALAPDKPEVHDTLVNAYLALGDRYFEQYLLSEKSETYTKAIEAYRQAFTLAPNKPAVRQAMMQAYLVQGQQDLEQSLPFLILASDSQEIRQTMTQAYLALGERYLEQYLLSAESRAGEKAMEAYRQAFTLAPGDLAVRQAMIQAYRVLGDRYFEPYLLDGVIAVYKTNTQRNPDELQFYWELAEAYQSLGRMEEAIALYAEAVDRQPDNPSAHLRLGRACQAEGEIEQAIAAYERVIELKPTSAAYTSLGSLYQVQGQSEKAIALYRAAARKNRGAAWPHIQLGKIYLEQADLR